MRKALEGTEQDGKGSRTAQCELSSSITYRFHGINLDEGMKMIRRAVDQRPDDGYTWNGAARLVLLPYRQLR